MKPCWGCSQSIWAEMLDSSVTGTRNPVWYKYMPFCKMPDHECLFPRSWIFHACFFSPPLTSILYDFPSVEHCICNFPCEMILLYWILLLIIHSPCLLAFCVIRQDFVSHLQLCFYLPHSLPITYMPVSQYCGTCPPSLVINSALALGLLRIWNSLSLNPTVVGHIALPFK